MATVDVRIPFPGTNITSQQVSALAIAQYCRVSTADALQLMEAWAQQNQVYYREEWPPARMRRTPRWVDVRVDIPDEKIRELRGEIQDDLAELPPDVRRFLRAQGTSTQLGDDQIDDMGHVIEIAEQLTEAERAAFEEAHPPGAEGGSIEGFAAALDAFVEDRRLRAQQLQAELEHFDEAAAGSLDIDAHISELEALLASPLAREGMDAALSAELAELQAKKDERIARAAAVEVPEELFGAVSAAALATLGGAMPGASSALEALCVDDAIESFGVGVARGYALEVPDGGHTAVPISNFAEFYAGYLYGLGHGVASGVADLVGMIWLLVQAGTSMSPAGIAWDIYQAGSFEEYGAERYEQAQKIVAICTAFRDFGAEFVANPTTVAGNIGTMAGRIIADEVQEFLNDNDWDKGVKIGKAVGIVLFEVLAEILVALASVGIGNLARGLGGAVTKANTAARALASGPRAAAYAQRLKSLVQGAPAIRRLMRALAAAENAGDATRLTRMADEGAEAVREADRLTGALDDAARAAPDRAPRDGPPRNGGSSGDGPPRVPDETPEEREARFGRMEDLRRLAEQQFAQHGRSADEIPSPTEAARIAEQARRLGLAEDEIADAMNAFAHEPGMTVDDLLDTLPLYAQPADNAADLGGLAGRASTVQREAGPVLPTDTHFGDGTPFNTGDGPRSMAAPSSVMDDQTRELLRGHGAPSVSEEIAGTGGIQTIEARRVAGSTDGEMIVAIEGEILPGRLERGSGALEAGQTRAPNYNSAGTGTQPAMRDLGFADPGAWERLHLWGPGFGDEAAAGMYAGPKELNQAWQNRGIEDLIRELGRQVAPHRGAGYRLRCRAQVQTWGRPTPGGFETANSELLVRDVRYEITLEMPGGEARTARVDLTLETDPADINAGARPAISVGLDENAFSRLFDGLPTE